jgi:predicted ATPase
MLTGDASAQQSANKIAPENGYRLRPLLARSVQILVEVAPELVGLFVPGAKLIGFLGKAVAKQAGWMDKLDQLASKTPSATGSALDQGRVFEQYTAFLRQLSADAPLILFLDDLQWADNASIGLLFHLARQIDNSRILLLGAFRPDDVALGRSGQRHPLEMVIRELTRYYGDITVDLDAIPEEVSRQFVDALLDAEPNRLGPVFRSALYRQTGGQALFTVELIRSLQERGELVQDGQGNWVESPTLNWAELPARVEGVIEERMARLADPLRELLTVASVEGEEFTAEVVARVLAIPEREAVRRLSDDLRLQHRLVIPLGFVQWGSSRLARYRFAHNLFYQYLYSSIGAAERAYLHQDVGQVLEGLFADRSDEIAAQLARHFEEAGILSKAAGYRLQAGNRARHLSANEEAVAHLTRGLELLQQIAPGPEAIQMELAMQTALGTALIAIRGYGSAEVAQAFTRARELSRAMGDPPQAIPGLYGLCLFRLVRGQVRQAQEEGEQVLRLAQDTGLTGYVMGCHLQLGASALYMGYLEQARAHVEQVLALYDPERHHDLAYEQSQDPAAAALSYLSWALWFQGLPEQAMAKGQAAIELAERLDHPYSLCLATIYAAVLHELLRQWPECQTKAEAGLELAKQGHFPVWGAMGVMLGGSARIHQGQVEEGIAQLREGLARFEATGAGLAVPYFRARLAEAYLIAGRREEGLQALVESQQASEQTWWQPEQLRLHAELLLLGNSAEPEAEELLREALDLARSQKSRPLELRAATSLARLLQAQGRAVEGHGQLTGSYAGFGEGFDSADLLEAKRLLETLQP